MICSKLKTMTMNVGIHHGRIILNLSNGFCKSEHVHMNVCLCLLFINKA